MAEIELPNPEEAVHESVRPWLYWALNSGGRKLAGMALPPEDYDFQRLSALGLGAVVSLVGATGYDHAPLEQRVFRLHDLVGGHLPPDPEREILEVGAAVAEVRALLDRGTGVVVHCHAGIGRAGTVIGSVLTSLGVPPDEVAAYLDAVQRRRGAGGWPESDWQRQVIAAFAPGD